MHAEFDVANSRTSHEQPQSRARALADEMPCIIEADCWQWSMWCVMQLLLVLYIAVVTPLRVAFSVCAPWGSVFFSMDMFIDTYFIADIFLNFLVAETHDGIIEHDLRMIRQRYLSKWFIPDVLSSIPISYFTLAIQAAGQSEAKVPGFKMLRFLRLFKLVKLVKAQKSLKKLAVDTDNAKMRTFYSAVGDTMGLLKYGFYVLYIAHILSCGWYMAGAQTHHPHTIIKARIEKSLKISVVRGFKTLRKIFSRTAGKYGRDRGRSPPHSRQPGTRLVPSPPNEYRDHRVCDNIETTGFYPTNLKFPAELGPDIDLTESRYYTAVPLGSDDGDGDDSLITTEHYGWVVGPISAIPQECFSHATCALLKMVEDCLYNLYNLRFLRRIR